MNHYRYAYVIKATNEGLRYVAEDQSNGRYCRSIKDARLYAARGHAEYACIPHKETIIRVREDWIESKKDWGKDWA